MTIDKQNLKALAEAANAVTTDVNITMAVGTKPEEVKAVQDYLQLAMPRTVLALLAEIERLEDGEQVADDLCAQLSELLGGIAVALRGPEKPSHRHGFSDLPSRVKVVIDERDQLKAENEVLREALTDCVDSLEGELLQKFGGQAPQNMHPVTYRSYCRDMTELAGYRAALSKDASHG